MSSAVPPAPPEAPGPVPGASGPSRRARKRFILVGLGVGLLAVLLMGLLTGIGTNHGSGAGARGAQPQPGDPVPSFAARNIGPVGGGRVTVPSSEGERGAPTVLLFFGNWCPSCHQELPPLAAAVRHQQVAGGPLSRIRVMGVDSEDSPSSARSFIASSGVRFPVAYDPDLAITEGTFDFHGDPYAVFVKGDGTVAQVVAGAVLTPASLTADEQALIPNGT